MSFIDPILERLTIDEILKYLPDLEQHGANYVGKCPTGHSSKSGTSFQVNTLEPTFQCWNCGVKGNYIHLVELIQHGRCSSGAGYTDTFAATCAHLCETLGIEKKGNYSDHDNVYDTILSVMRAYQKQLPDSLIDVIKGTYGFTEDFIKMEGIGFGDKCPSTELLEFYTKEDLLKTGLFNMSEKCKSGLFHIYQNRIVFPYNIRDRVRYSIGRKTRHTKGYKGKDASKYFKQYIHTEKRPYVAETIKNQIVYCQNDSKDIVIAEGIPDYLSLKMHGQNTVSAVTTRFKGDEYKQVVDFCKKFNRVFIANDNEDNKAGMKGALKMGELLLRAGIHPRIIIIPKPTDVSKMDVAEFIRDCDIDEFLALKETAVGVVDTLIQEIDPAVEKEFLYTALGPVIDLLAVMSEDMVDIYIQDKICKHFHLSSMKSILTTIKQKVMEKKGIKNEKLTGTEGIFAKTNDNFQQLSAGQDFIDGTLYYTVTRPMVVEGAKGIKSVVNDIYVVTSDRKIQPVIDYQILSDELAFKRKLSGDYQKSDWPFTRGDYSIQRYVDGHTKTNPAEIYKKIRDNLQRYTYHESQDVYSFIAVIPMLSYCFMLCHAVGYIHFFAEKQSGKTTTMEILTELGFNARMSSSISDAAIFRIIESYRPMLGIDEAENLNPTKQQRDSGQSERLELYKSGYKRNGAATRCEGQNNSVTEFSNYGIKIFASIKSMDSTLEDRTHVILFKRAQDTSQIQEWLPQKTKTEFDELVSMMHCMALEHASELSEIYNTLDKYRDTLESHKITFRNREIWAGYLSMALLIDKYEPGLNVFGDLLSVALDTIESKAAFNSESRNLMALERLYLWTKKEKSNPSIAVKRDGDKFLRKSLVDVFIKEELQGEDEDEDFDYMKYNILKNVLRRYHVINKNSEIRNTSVDNTRGSALVLDPIKMLAALKTYKEGDVSDEVLSDFASLNGAKDIDIYKDLGMD